MAKALHPFIHDGKQYYCGDEVLAEGEELKRLRDIGCVERVPSKSDLISAELAEPDKPDEPRRSRGKKKG